MTFHSFPASYCFIVFLSQYINFVTASPSSNVDIPQIRKFCRIFDRFHMHGRIFLTKCILQFPAHSGKAPDSLFSYPSTPKFSYPQRLRKIRIDLIIRNESCIPSCARSAFIACVKTGFLCIQIHCIRCKQQICHNHRITCYIIAAQI